MTLKSFLTPAVVVLGVLFVLATLQQATGLFVQTFSSAGAVSVGPDAAPTPVAVGRLTPIDGLVTRADVAAVVATATSTAGPVALTETPGPAATPSATLTAVAEATATATVMPNATVVETPVPTPGATASPSPPATPPQAATPTPMTTVSPIPTATPIACLSEGVVLAMEPVDGVLQFGVNGEAGFALVNQGNADLREGAILRLFEKDGVTPAEGLRLVIDERALANDATQAWLLPLVAAATGLDIVLSTAPASGGDALSSDAVPAPKLDAAVAVELREWMVMAQVTYDCQGAPVVVAQHKLVLRAAPLPAPEKPVPTSLEPAKAQAADVVIVAQ